MRLLEGALQTSDGAQVPIPRGGLVHQGWGATGLISLSASRPHAWPANLTLTWFSLVDDRFYDGHFDLPHAQICKQGAAGLSRPGGTGAARCSTVLVGMAPGGRAALWMVGGGLAVQLCLLRARERDIQWEAMPAAESLSREAYRQLHLQRILGNGPAELSWQAAAATQRWDRRNRKCRWHPLLLADDDTATLRITAFNGDREHLESLGPVRAEAMDAIAERGLPRSLTVHWTDPRAGRLIACIDMDEDELFAALDKLAIRQPAAQALQLHLEPCGNDGLRIYLCDAAYSLELLAARVRVFQDQ